MLSRSDLDALGGLSQRAQIAYALSCIEATVRAYDLRGDAFDEWNERAWRRTSAPKSEWRSPPWPRNFAEIDALLDPAVGGWGEGVSDVLRKVFELAANACEELLERGDASATLRALVTELARHGIEAPPLAPYLRSPSTEMAGVGRSVPPAFFREALDREGFADHFWRQLQSGDRIAARGAATACAHVGVGTRGIVDALGDALFAGDPELALLAENALQALVSPHEFTELLRSKKAMHWIARGRVLMESANPSERIAGVRQVKDLVQLDEGLLEVLMRLAVSDPDRATRLAAVEAAFSAATFKRRVSDEDLFALLLDRDPAVQARVAMRVSPSLAHLALASIDGRIPCEDPIRRAAYVFEMGGDEIWGRTVARQIAALLLEEPSDATIRLWLLLQRCHRMNVRVLERLSEIRVSVIEPASAARLVDAETRLHEIAASRAQPAAD